MYLNHEVAFLDTLLCRSLLSLTDACWDTWWLIDLSKERVTSKWLPVYGVIITEIHHTLLYTLNSACNSSIATIYGMQGKCK